MTEGSKTDYNKSKSELSNLMIESNSKGGGDETQYCIKIESING